MKKSKQKRQMMFQPPVNAQRKQNEYVFPMFIDKKLSTKGILSTIGGVIYLENGGIPYKNEYLADNFKKFKYSIHFSIKQHEANISGYSFICQNTNIPAHFALLASNDNKKWTILDEQNDEKLNYKDKSVIYREIEKIKPFQHFVFCSTTHYPIYISYFELFGTAK